MPTVMGADRSVGSVNGKTLSIEVPGGRLAAEHWAGTGPTLVLLHAGVADRRAWAETAERLAGAYAVVAYDRRGFGESPLSQDPFTHVEDLRAVLDAVGANPVWLVGSSQGGKVALDATLAYPERVAGLVLLAPAISGAPDEGEADPETERLDGLMEAADAAGDLDEVNRLEAWLWLDGPAGPEGRVGGPARELLLAMNAIALRSEAESAAGAGNSEIDAWSPTGRDHRAGDGGLGRAGHRDAQRALPGAGRAAARRVRPGAAERGPPALPREP